MIRLPTAETIEEELDVPNYQAIELLSSYKSKDKEEEGDLNKLFEGIDISDHGVIWICIVLGKLQVKQVDSYWIVLNYILRDMSTVICIRILEHFKYELIRFESNELDKLCQSIVFGSKYPMCTAIRISGYMNDLAKNDLTRVDEFKKLGIDYSKLAIHLLNEYSEGDHLAAILLEIDSDIDGGLSAIDLALKYRVVNFVSNTRIDRVRIFYYIVSNIITYLTDINIIVSSVEVLTS